MSHANFQVSLKLILVNKQKQILGLGVNSGCSFFGFYDLPGGRIDEEEIFLDFSKILKREIKEELGNIKFQIEEKPITAVKYIVPGKFKDDKKDLPMMYVFFVARYISGKIKISHEHENFAWLSVNKNNVAKYFSQNYLNGVKKYLEEK